MINVVRKIIAVHYFFLNYFRSQRVKRGGESEKVREYNEEFVRLRWIYNRLCWNNLYSQCTFFFFFFFCKIIQTPFAPPGTELTLAY